MNLSKLYAVAKKRHGDVGEDVVHDLVLKFGGNLPSEAYLIQCIKRHKPKPLVEMNAIENSESFEQVFTDNANLDKALQRVHVLHEVEVDTFLECRVNGSLREFSRISGVSASVLEKICNFVKYEILTEFNRLQELDDR